MSMIFQQIAPVLSGLALLLAGSGYLFGCRPAFSSERPQPTLTIETAYPGAKAQVVAATVAVPIEQQINGVEKMLCMRSQCKSDSSYALTVTFDDSIDRVQAQRLVQDRLSLALPTLPEAVKRLGVTVKQESPGVLMICSLSSPDGSRDSLYLSDVAALQLRYEMLSLPGVGEIALLGNHDSCVRLLLDSEKMTARNLTVSDVASALKQQNFQAAAGQIGQPPVGRPPDAEQFGGVILKTDAEGRIVRLSDVARIELRGGQPRNVAFLRGKSLSWLWPFPRLGKPACSR
jgi:multidrug efflux pump